MKWKCNFTLDFDYFSMSAYWLETQVVGQIVIVLRSIFHRTTSVLSCENFENNCAFCAINPAAIQQVQGTTANQQVQGTTAVHHRELLQFR